MGHQQNHEKKKPKKNKQKQDKTQVVAWGKTKRGPKEGMGGKKGRGGVSWDLVRRDLDHATMRGGCVS